MICRRIGRDVCSGAKISNRKRAIISHITIPNRLSSNRFHRGRGNRLENEKKDMRVVRSEKEKKIGQLKFAQTA